MAAARQFRTISVVDLSRVCGGVDRQTRALQLALEQAANAIQDVAKSIAPKNAGMVQMMLQLMSRRPGRGPTPAPALPPPTTLTR